MKLVLQVVSWIAVVLGVLAVIGSLDPADGYGIFGGILFWTQGMLTLVYIKRVEDENS